VCVFVCVCATDGAGGARVAGWCSVVVSCVSRVCVCRQAPPPVSVWHLTLAADSLFSISGAWNGTLIAQQLRRHHRCHRRPAIRPDRNRTAAFSKKD
jgi:hypothetical protein